MGFGLQTILYLLHYVCFSVIGKLTSEVLFQCHCHHLQMFAFSCYQLSHLSQMNFDMLDPPVSSIVPLVHHPTYSVFYCFSKPYWNRIIISEIIIVLSDFDCISTKFQSGHHGCLCLFVVYLV